MQEVSIDAALIKSAINTGKTQYIFRAIRATFYPIRTIAKFKVMRANIFEPAVPKKLRSIGGCCLDREAASSPF